MASQRYGWIVRLLRRRRSGTEACALPDAPAKEGFGAVPNVYADRARELADRREFEVVLGHVIAHELGQLLLGKNAHSAAGVMHARWGAQDLRLSRQAAMLFLPGEEKRIRAHVRARTVDTAH